MFAILHKVFCSPVDSEDCVTDKSTVEQEAQFATESGVLDTKTMADMGWVNGKTGMRMYTR